MLPSRALNLRLGPRPAPPRLPYRARAKATRQGAPNASRFILGAGAAGLASSIPAPLTGLAVAGAGAAGMLGVLSLAGAAVT